MIIDETIPGWMSQRELELIAKVASEVPENGLIIEIGSFAGRSAYHWAANSHSTVKLVCFEPNRIFIDKYSRKNLLGDPTQVDQGVHCHEMFRHYMKPFLDKVELLNQLSPPPSWDRLANVVFIDGDHSFHAISRDLEFWYRKLEPKGRFLGHDAKHGGVSKALKGFIADWCRRIHPGTDIWEIEHHVKYC